MSELKECGWCGLWHGPKCPSVKAIEYFPHGGVKRVEFMTVGDYMPPTAPIAVQPSPYGVLQPFPSILPNTTTWSISCDGTSRRIG